MKRFKFSGLSLRLRLLLSCVLAMAMLVPAAVMPVMVGAMQAVPNGYERIITIDHTQVPQDLSGFPLMVKLSGDGGLKSNATLSDIYFTDSENTVLPYEIEYFSKSSGDLVAWVKTDLSGILDIGGAAKATYIDTIIKLKYGGSSNSSPGDVWDANYKGVWHMGQTPAVNSTSTANYGSVAGAGTISVVNGNIGSCLDFPGSNLPDTPYFHPSTPAYLDCGNDSSLAFSPTGSYTWSSWVNPTMLQAGGSGIFQKKASGTDSTGKGYVVNIGNNTASVRFQSTSGNTNGKFLQSNALVNLTAWNYVTVTYNNGTSKIYLDGNIDITGNVATAVDNSNFFIGRRLATDATQGYFYGKIDEARYSTTDRSANWIKTEYNNQKSGSTLCSITDEVDTLLASTGFGGSISPTGYITANHGNSQTFHITPDTGYKIDDVSVDGFSVGAVSEYAFSPVTSNHSIYASFAPLSFTISASAGENGSIDPEGEVPMGYSLNETFTITPDEGYRIADVLVDSSSVGPVGSYTFNNLTDNHAIEAIFEEGYRWYLDNNGKLIKTGPELTGTLPIDPDASLDWQSLETAGSSGYNFSGTWYVKIPASSYWPCSAQIGYGSAFQGFGSPVSSTPEMFENGYITIPITVSGEITSGEHMAVQITNNSASTQIIFTDRGSFIILPDDVPDFPLPEAAGWILFGLGAIGLVAFITIRRKKLVKA